MMKKSGSGQRGFTLLELLVVMFILVILVGLVSPYIKVGSEDDVLKAESHTLRFTLQNVVDQSWITGNNFVVMKGKDSSLSIWQEKKGEWKQLRILYTLPKSLSLQLKTDSTDMKKALEAIHFNKNGKLVFLSSGEYLPFTLTLRSTDSSVNISGDGINEIVIE